MVLFIILYEETVSISEVMDISDFVTKNNIIQYYKTNRKLVRKLIMYLPNWLFKPPTRIVFIKSPMTERQLSQDELLSISECSKETDNISDGFENDSNIIHDNSRIVSFISRQPDVVIHNTSYNNPFNEISSEYKIKQLEQQLMDIREEIKEIFFILSNKNQSNLDFGLEKQDEKSDEENIVSPPPAPPLPPEITEVQCKIPDKRKFNVQQHRISTKTTVTMADVLKEMNKVKLKPVQRTPGGRPMRNTSLNLSKSNNLSPDLQVILKRRFSAMHNISPTSPDTSLLKRSNSQDSFYDNF